MNAFDFKTLITSIGSQRLIMNVLLLRQLLQLQPQLRRQLQRQQVGDFLFYDLTSPGARVLNWGLFLCFRLYLKLRMF